MMQQSNCVQQKNGFALVAALFLIIVLAALGLFAVKLSSTQQQSIDLELLGARAQAAADSGIEYAASQLFKNGKTCANIASTYPFTQSALKGFSAQITCAPIPYSPHIDGAATHQVYELTSTSTYGTYGTTTYVSRQQKRTVMN